MFFQGDPKECRVRVQALNERYHQIKNAQDERKLEQIEMQEQLEEERLYNQQQYGDQYNHQQGNTYVQDDYQQRINYSGQLDQGNSGTGYPMAHSNGAYGDPNGQYQMNQPAKKTSRWAKYLDENDEPF